MRQKLVLWFLLVLTGFLIWVHPAVFQTAAGTAGSIGIDKTIGILPVQPTIGTASRHNHDDVSGSGAEKLREGWGVFKGRF